MDRGTILREVADLITKDRSETHGEAVGQLAHATELKLAVGHRDNPHLTKTEIEAIDCICMKLSRIAMGKPILDHYRDIAGYAAIAAEARSLKDFPLISVQTEKAGLWVGKFISIGDRVKVIGRGISGVVINIGSQGTIEVNTGSSRGECFRLSELEPL